MLSLLLIKTSGAVGSMASRASLCANCGANAIQACSGCKLVCYCSKECQKDDWKKCHKFFCTKQGIEDVPKASAEQEATNQKKTTNSGEKECANCRVQGNNLKISMCSRCQLTSYCSKSCQLQHWSAVGGHKKFCVSASVKLPVPIIIASPPSSENEFKCAVCQDKLLAQSSSILACSHIFHSDCLTTLRESNITQLCPICRSPLSEGKDIESVYNDAAARLKVLAELVGKDGLSWALLTSKQRKEMGEIHQLLLIAANLGHADAQVGLGLFYAKSYVGNRSYSDAFHWYEKAANQGNAAAQANMGLMYHLGQVVKQCDIKACHWMEKAANQDNFSAQFFMATMCDLGRGVKQSSKKAFRWFEKAAQQGDATAQYCLGIAYKNGLGVQQSDREAFRWLSNAANQGHEKAKELLKSLW